MPVTLLNYSLTTLAKVKLYLGISGSTQDDYLNTLINNVTGFIEGYCGNRRFLATNYVEIYDSERGKKKLFLNQLPINSFTSLEYRTGTPSIPSWVTYSADSYLTYKKEGYLGFYGSLPWVMQGLRATYNAGYLIDFTDETNATLHTLPFDLVGVATELVGAKYRSNESEGTVSQSTEGQSVTFSSQSSKISTEQKTVLSKYKLYVV